MVDLDLAVERIIWASAQSQVHVSMLDVGVRRVTFGSHVCLDNEGFNGP